MLQGLLINNETTLRAGKEYVYVLLKILKFCTGSSVKSFQCKFAVREINDIEGAALGMALKKVILYRTLRGKFSSVHPELRRLGIIKVQVGDTGLHFLRDRGDFHCFTKSHFL